jgi:predicted transglutaminase-like cysteine proteinase
MVRFRVSITFQRRVKVLVRFPLIVSGLAIVCAAACFSSLTILSVALKVSDHHFAEARLPGAHLVPRGELTTAALARVRDEPQQRIQFVSFESRFASALPLLRSDAQPLPQSNLRTTNRLASISHEPQRGIQFIRFDEPTLAPMAFTQFCLRYPGDCKPQQVLFGDGRIVLNALRWSELETVNRAVNASIHPERNEEGLAGEKWLLSPARGDCNDYAVTKRHQLIARGWPARDVLLSEVVTGSGEHHVVTVVRTSGGDFVLDNLTDRIMPWSRTPYRWVRIQTPRNPNYWASISNA